MIEKKQFNDVILFKRCHVCLNVDESRKEIKKCSSCEKSFLPLNYFGKIHSKNSVEFENLFEDSISLNESDLIKGINVLW